MQKLSIDVADLAGKPGSSKPIVQSQPIGGLRGVLAWIDDDEPVALSLKAESLHDGIAVWGVISGKMNCSCARCLRPYESSLTKQVNEVFYFRPEGNEDVYEVKEMKIDLEPMVRDAVVLEIPIRPLHDPQCKGLCPACGADLNETDCGHSNQPADLRWAPLRELMTISEETNDAGT